MLTAVEKGFSTLSVPNAVRAAALRNLRAWVEGTDFAVYRPQLQRLIERERWDFLLDSFYRVIPFGTGGRRGPVGIGLNRINAYTVATSIQGHADYLRQHLGTGPLRVVVAFDCRIFNDLRANYDAGLPNPLLGMRSRDFARLAAGVYAANGISVCTVSGDDLLMSTPELSFAIRHLGAAGGLNVSASHNHPDDNGAKFYTDYGGQPVAPHDEEMANAVAAVQQVASMSFDKAVRDGLVQWWSATDHDAYVGASLARSLDQSARNAFIVYSPLNGTGRRTVHDVLAKAGFRIELVPNQAQYDGEFPTVKYRVPNPEVPEAFEAAIAEAHRLGADAAFASDPDADRLGVVVTAPDGDRFLNGNEIGALLTAYIIESRAGSVSPHAFVIKTGVTTELITAIARAHAVHVVGDLLVGFKYVGEVMEAVARTGHYGDLQAGIDDFLFAAEESNGVLVTPALRDKDAAGGALLLAERIAQLKRDGKTLVDDLDRIHARYGYFAHGAYSLIMEGVVGLQRIEDMMSALRTHAPAAIAGRRVSRTIDYWDERDHGAIKSSTDRASRNVVAFYFDGGLKITARPSGTEPKLKMYVEAGGETGGDAATKARVDDLVKEATLQMAEHLLASLKIRVPRFALALSQLVSVENRTDFAERFISELQSQLDRGGGGPALEQWLDQRLERYGKDGRFLVAPGIKALLESGASGLTKHVDVLRALFQLS